MKATIDLPDALYRQVKARAAMEGRSIREVSIELYEQWLAGRTTSAVQRSDPAEAAGAWLSRWEELGKEIARRGVDPRPTREILLAERR